MGYRGGACIVQGPNSVTGTPFAMAAVTATIFFQMRAQFADQEWLEIRLIYDARFHSKCNTIERYWGGLERSWNGYLLDSVQAVLERAGSFVWRTHRTVISLIDKV